MHWITLPVKTTLLLVVSVLLFHLGVPSACPAQGGVTPGVGLGSVATPSAGTGSLVPRRPGSPSSTVTGLPVPGTATPGLHPAGYLDPAVDHAGENAAQVPPPARSPSEPEGPWQQARWITTWVSGGDPGLLEQKWDSTWAFPTVSREYPLVITPGFRWVFFAGPATPDVPAQALDLTLDLRWICPLGEGWMLDVAVTPGLHSDFQQETSRAFRIPGRLIAVWEQAPGLKWLLGLTYLDRDDVQFLPVAGVIWTPDQCHRLELAVPKPRYAYCYSRQGDVSRWWYVAGEFGGGSWAVERASGQIDMLNYYDIRLVIGWERKSESSWNAFVELGYVFGRNLDYLNGPGTLEPDDAALVRAGVVF